jgi:hypothetical protein
MLKPHGPAAAAVNGPLKNLPKSGILGNVDEETGEFQPRTMHQEMPISETASGRIQTWPTAPRAKLREPAPPDPRAALINATFGGGEKSPLAKIATAAGGPFAQWLTDIVPRNVGSAIVKHPDRVAAATRVQNIANRDVLNDQPYKLQEGGPIGDFGQLVTDPQKYASRIGGPITQQDSNAATHPTSFSLGDALKGLAYNAVPGRSVIGPFFGDTMYPNKAPAVPSASLEAGLGWHFSNKTPATDAILRIMQQTGLNKDQAARLYEQFKR